MTRFAYCQVGMPVARSRILPAHSQLPAMIMAHGGTPIGSPQLSDEQP